MNTFEQIFNNPTLWVAILSWAIAQLIKFFIEVFKNKKVRLSLFFSSGGMPSSHTSFVTAMATSVGMLEGFNSTAFALSAVLSLIVMYDAAGVRRAAGKHAAAINNLIENIEDTGFKLDTKLKELLGHSPIEVAAGAVLGVITSVLLIK